jgi:glucose-1-phosphate thymidylyltransferase
MPGIYFFRRKIFDAIRTLRPSYRNELEITEAIQTLIDWNCNIDVEIIDGWWKDTGIPEDILDANRLVLSNIKPSIKSEVKESIINGNVIIDEDSVIDCTSVLKGPLIIGRNCTISNSYIGPYTSIGNNCTIQNAEIEDTIVMENSRILDAGKIVESLIGKNALIKRGGNLPKGIRLIVGDSSQVIL